VSNEATSTRAQLDAWRECGADRLDPVRFRLIEAMERRAASHGGEARRLLDARLSELVGHYAARVERAVPAAESQGLGPARSALGELVDELASRAPTDNTLAPELIDYFRKIWSQVRTETQLRQSQGLVPQNAGPLNSSNLVHRSLSLMRELSPGYLQHFLSYVDSLAWLEQLNGGEAAAAKEAPRTAAGKKSTRSKTR
jgi:hypothetical protein